MSHRANRKQHDTKRKKDKKPAPELPFNPEESSLVQHARREIELAGIDKTDSDYGGAIATCLLELVTLFASQRHSGGSAEITRQIFNELVSFRPLTPITNEPEEWQSVSKFFDEPMWQNKRWPEVFSKDGGKSAFLAATKEPVKLISKKQFDAQKKKATTEEVTLTEKPKADS